MPTSTPRGFRYPLNSDAPNIQTDMGNLATDCDGQFVESTAALRPAAGKVGRKHRASDTGAVSLDIGSAWVDIANPDNSTLERSAAGVLKVKDAGIGSTQISSTLKPSGGAAAGTEALRAIGTTSSTACAGNDARLSDQRTPSDNSVTNAKVSAGAAIAESKLSLASDAAAGTASRRTLGTGATQACAGNDSRLSNSRPPSGAAGGVLAGTYPNPTWAVEPIPAGMGPLPWAGNSAPAGWLLCDGAAVSRTTYSALFAVVGTTYGAGDGSTTFNLPDMRDRVAVGASGTIARGATGGAKTHALSTGEMPSHDHPVQNSGNNSFTNGSPPDSGARTDWAVNASIGFYGTNTQVIPGVTLGRAIPSGGGAAHNNMQPYVGLNYVIKT